MRRRLWAALLLLSIDLPAAAAAQRPTVEEIVALVGIEEPGLRAAAAMSPDATKALVVSRRAVDSRLEYSLFAVDATPAACASAAADPLRAASAKGLVGRAFTTGNLPAISSALWGPDGLVYYLGFERGAARLWRGTPGASPRALSPPGDDVVAFGIGGGRAFVAVAEPQAAPGRSIFTVDKELAFDVAYPEVSDIRERFPVVTLKSIDLASGQISIVRRGLGVFARLYMKLWPSPDGNHVVVVRPAAQVPASWARYENSVGEAYRIVPGPQAPESYGPVSQFVRIDARTGEASALVDAPTGQRLGIGSRQEALWAPDSRSVILLNTMLPLEGVDSGAVERRKRTGYLASVDVPTRQVTEVSPVELGSRSTRVYSGLRWGDAGALEGTALFEGSGWKRARFSHSPSGWRFEGLSNLDPAGAEVVMRESLNTAPDLWLQGGGAEACRLSDLNPQLREMNLLDAEAIEWVDANGRRWKGGLLLPEGYAPGRRYPLVIQTHGFSASRFLWDGAHPTAMPGRALAARGFVVLQMTDNFERIATPEEAPIHVAGMEAAVEELERRGLVDPARVGLVGFSATCQYVKVALARSRIRFAAAVVADGIDMSYMQYILATNIDGGRLQRVYDSSNGGTPFGDGLSAFMDRAPGFNTAGMRTPLLIQALGRRGVFFEWEFFALFRRQGKPVEMLVLRDAAHSLVRPDDRRASLQATVDWMDFWIRNVEDEAPGKEGQYRRWRVMRASDAAAGSRPPR